MKVFSVVVLSLFVCVFVYGSAGVRDDNSGSCGQNMTWEYNPNTYTLTISGTGIMDAIKGGKAPWQSHKSSIQIVVISEGVTSITASAFYQCKALKNVSIPSSVISIGESAFRQCTALTSVILPQNLTVIEASLFADSTSLSSVNFPPNITSIGTYAFTQTKLTTVTIPSSVKTIGTHAFNRIDTLTTVILNEGLTSIGTGAFSSSNSLSTISIPSTVTSIGNSAFLRCNITSITIPSGVKTIEYDTFWNCSSLTNVTLSDGLTSIGSRAFEGCISLSSITIPSSVTSIAGNAFNGCDNMAVIYHGQSEPSFCDAFNSTNMTDVCAPIDYNSTSFCGRQLFTNLTITDDVRKHNNECYEVIGCGNTVTVQKRLNASEWEDRTDGCVEYKCDYDKGAVINVLCEAGGNEICYNGKCVEKGSVDEEGVWMISLETEVMPYRELNYTELIAAISEMSGVEPNALDIKVEFDGDGNIISIILVLNNEEDVINAKIVLEECKSKTSKREDGSESSDGKCPGIFHYVKRVVTIKVPQIVLSVSSSEPPSSNLTLIITTCACIIGALLIAASI